MANATETPVNGHTNGEVKEIKTVEDVEKLKESSEVPEEVYSLLSTFSNIFLILLFILSLSIQFLNPVCGRRADSIYNFNNI